ncbi:DNA polymerase [Choristoneura occidentalis granulovirus]|uniref:DNA-directed DNA polymerase n=2 Tax=Betabaculovirus chofumiferanae TaxID=3051997 RepID=Q1A4K6_9BBAC|nr:DNA polymerase [Choristoneura fumiferana granulovirus]ABC61224.1 DNA polymerase [Choristoneura fumiferana granulovirus]
MSDIDRKLQETDVRPAKIRKLNNEVPIRRGFKVYSNAEELFSKILVSAGATYDNTNTFLITRLRYESGFLYLFLTGLFNVQFYFRTPCTIYSFKRCFHNRTPCMLKCKSYKSMVVTGLKQRECHRLNVYKVDREKCKVNDTYILDDFCTDENRVQMQLGIYEGDYIRFKDGVSVDKNCCAIGSLSSIEKVDVKNVTEPIENIVGCYDLETYTNLQSFSNAKIDPIITISYVLKTHTETKRFCFINTQAQSFRLDDDVEDNIELVDGEVIVIPYDNEHDMLASFLKLLFRSNPDDILDYNGDKFDLPYILQRAEVLNIDKKFIFRYDLPLQEMNTVRVNTKFGYNFDNFYMKYYNHLDVYQFMKSSIDACKLENLKLDTVASFYLKVGKVELPVREMMRLYNEKAFAKIVKYNVRDSILPLEMYRKCKMANKMYADAGMLYMTRDDSNLTIWRKINLALFNRAINNTTDSGQLDEYFFNKFDLSKIMHRKKATKSRKEDDDNESEEDENEDKDEGEVIDFSNLERSRVPLHQIPTDSIALCDLKTKIKYTGGKVLSPVPGFYNLIFTLDFSQLYTSIMIFYTCCLSNLFYGANNKLYLQRNTNAVATKFLKEKAEERAMYKKEMKKHDTESFTYQMYDSWQNAAKLVCNSKYGWLGLACKPLANFITSQGRLKLEEAQKFIKSLDENAEIKNKWNLSTFKLDVVYGDTDSNFVSAYILPEEFELMGGIEVFRKLILEDILKPLNEIWKGAFKMELENIMLGTLIKGKKSYMCLKSNNTLYKRGLNVKKDTPMFLRKAFDNVYLQVLTKHSLDCVLNNLLKTLKLKYDNFSAATSEEYSFSQTLNETKNGVNGNNLTIAYVLFMQLRNDPNTKYVPSSGDRIPYMLVDSLQKKVRDRAKPTQLFTDNDVISWSKHLGVLCTFFNDLMSMVGNDILFVYAFQEICSYFQKKQKFGVIYPYIKKMTNSRIKDIVCKEINIKNKKDLSDNQLQSILDKKLEKFTHTHEFTMTTRPPPYKVNVFQFNLDCPVCNGKGVAVVDKKMILNLS